MVAGDGAEVLADFDTMMATAKEHKVRLFQHVELESGDAVGHVVEGVMSRKKLVREDEAKPEWKGFGSSSKEAGGR